MNTAQWQGMETLEPRLMLSGVLDDISGVFIEQGVAYYNEQPAASHRFELGFEVAGEGLIESARFRLADEPDGWQAFEGPEADDGAEEWWFEIITADPNDFAGYTDQTFIFELTFTGGEVETITLAMEHPDTGDPLVQPSQVPVFTNVHAFATDVPLLIEFAWEPVTDPTVTSLELELGLLDPMTWDWDELFSTNLDPADTSSDPPELDADTLYGLAMLFDNGHHGETSEGVPFFVTKFTEVAFVFNTFSGLLEPIEEVFILRGLNDGLPGSDPLHEFEFGMISGEAGWFETATVRTPSGAVYELDHYEDMGQEGHEWFFEFVNADEGEFSDFGYGTYGLQLEFDGGLIVETRFDFADPDTGDPLTMPTDAPVLTAPLHGATDVATDVEFTWDPVTDPTIAGIMLWVVNPSTDEDVFEEELSPDTTSLAQSVLQPGTPYEASLLFYNAFFGLTNASGVEYVAATFRESAIEFTTAGSVDLWTKIDDVHLDRGVTALPGGAGQEWEFSFGFITDDLDWFETARLQSPAEQWYDLTLESDPEGPGPHRWEFRAVGATVDDIAAFTAGTYVLELELPGADTLTTSFLFDESLPVIETTPQFLAPLDGTLNVPIDVTFEWDASGVDANVQWLGVFDRDSGENLIDAFLDPAESSFDQSVLMADRSYQATLVVANGVIDMPNPDGVTYRMAQYASTEIEFATVGPFEPLAMINEVFIERAYLESSSEAGYRFEFRFESDQGGWFEQARFQSPGGNWYVLTADGFDSAGFGEEPNGRFEWFYEAESDDLLDLADFGFGTYVLEFTSAADQIVTTEFAYAPSFEIPQQTPEFVTPTDGAVDVPVDITFAWIAPTDPTVVMQWFELVDLDADEWILETGLDVGVTSLPQDLLIEGRSYQAELLYVNVAELVNDDGVSYLPLAYTGRLIEFQTAGPIDPLSLIAGVFIERGSGLLPDGTTMYMFEFGMFSGQTGWFDQAEFQIDGGPWYTLEADGGFDAFGNNGDGDAFEWFFEVESDDEADLAAFGPGTYTLRLTYGEGEQVTTDFVVDAMYVAPAEPAQFITPLHGETVAPDVTFEWTAAGQDVVFTWLDVEEVGMGDWLIEVNLDPTITTYAQDVLAFGATYQAAVAFVNGAELANADGIPYGLAMFNGSMIEFSTDEATVDLAPTNLEVVGLEEPVLWGDTGTVIVEVANLGTDAAVGEITVNLYLSTAQTLDGTETLVASITEAVNLAGGADTEYPMAVTIPDGLEEGQYYFLAEVLTDENIVEDDTSNNTATIGPGAIEARLADLEIAVDAVAFDGAILPGDRGTVTVTVTNSGHLAAPGPLVVRVYAATSESFDTVVAQIGQVARAVPLAPGGTIDDLNIPITVPTDVDPGSYYLFAMVDPDGAVQERSEDNNVAGWPVPIDVEAPVVDLVPQVSDVAFDEPVLPGDRGAVTVTVTNIGNTPTTGVVTVTLYASPAMEFGPEAIELGVASPRMTLPAGGSRDVVFNVTIPAEIEGEEECNLIAVIEPSDVIGETNTDNNIAVSAGPVLDDPIRDLFGEMVLFNMPNTIIPGDSAVARIAVGNAGNMPAVGEIRIAAYAVNLDDIEADPIAVSDPIELAINLAPGGTQIVNIPVSIGDDLAPDTAYQLSVIVDETGVIDDPDETNNEALLGGPRQFVTWFGSFDGRVNVPLTLEDAAGVAVTFTLTGGGHGVVDVDQDGRFEIALEGTTARSQARILTGANAITEIASVEADDDLQMFHAPTANLIGSMTFQGGLGQLTLNDIAEQHEITIGQLDGMTTDLRFNDVTDLTLTSATPIRLLQVNQWIDSDATADVIEAPWIGSLIVAGDFQANLILSGVDAPRGLTLGAVRIGGDVDDGNPDNTDWAIVAGDIGTVVIGGAVDNFALAAGNVRTLTFAAVATADITLAGSLNVLRADSWAGGGIEAGSLTSLIVDGDFSGALTLTDPEGRALGVVRVGGDMIYGDLDETDWAVAGAIGTVNIGGIVENLKVLGGDGIRLFVAGNVAGAWLGHGGESIGQVGAVRVDAWGDGGIVADFVGAFTVFGDSGATLTVDAGDGRAFNAARITGDITGGAWTITGTMGSLIVGGGMTDWTLDLGDATLQTLRIGDATNMSVTAGRLGVVRADSWAGGGIEAGSLNSLVVNGDFSGALTLTDPEGRTLGSVRVGGDMIYGDLDETDWAVAGAIGTVNVGGVVENLKVLGGDGIRLFVAGNVAGAWLGQGGESIGQVGAVRVDAWGDGGIVADFVGAFTVFGDSGATLTVDAGDGRAFNAARITGDITGGAWTITGTMGSLIVGGGMTDWTLDLGDATLQTLRIGDATNVSVTAGQLGAVRADSWSGGLIAADSVRALQIVGDADIDLTLSNPGGMALATMRVGGDLIGGQWAITGGLGAMNVVGELGGVTWNVSEDVRSILAGSVGGMTLDANAVRILTVRGDMAGAALTLDQPVDRRVTALTRMTVTGTMAETTIRSAGSVGVVTVGAMNDSVLFAGVKADYDVIGDGGVLALPLSVTNYDNPDDDGLLASIGNFTIRGGRNILADELFVNSNVAAGSIGRATIREPQLDNDGTPFGFAAVDQLHVIWIDGRILRIFGRDTWPDDTGDLTVAVAHPAPEGGDLPVTP